jgi:hypothetical protein
MTKIAAMESTALMISRRGAITQRRFRSTFSTS